MGDRGMGAFHRVEAEQAGPTALGILIPPARRTFVILRPRALAFDLLLCRSAGDPTFHALSHGEASVAAHSLYRGLRDGLARVEALGQLRVHVGPSSFVACSRLEGQPYAPLELDPAEAEALGDRLRSFLCPAGELEVYFNTRFFEHPAS